MLFFLLAKQFAANAGLVPPGRRFGVGRRAISLEGALIAGAALVLAGLGGIAATAGVWGKAGFGDLDYQATMRLVIPTVGAVTIGLQVLFFGFMSSLLDLQRA